MGTDIFLDIGILCSAIELNAAIIQKYIREQENEDIMEDKLSKKEYINPFKGILK